MAKLAVLACPGMQPATRALITALARRGHRVAVLYDEDVRRWPDAEHFDLVLERIPDRAGGRHGAGIAGWLTAAASVSDPLEASSAARDKLAGGRLMAGAGLPVPPFLEVGEAAAGTDPDRWLGAPPWIAKPRGGGRGESVCLVESVAAAAALQERAGVPYLLQSYIARARCYRVLCSRDLVLAAYAKGTDGPLVASISKGSERLPVPEPVRSALCALGQPMVAALGGHIMGADILEGQDGGLWALECNTVPGFDAGSDIAGRWAQWLERNLLA